MHLNNLLYKVRTARVFVNCFVLFLVQTTLNDIGNKPGEGGEGCYESTYADRRVLKEAYACVKGGGGSRYL